MNKSQVQEKALLQIKAGFVYTNRDLAQQIWDARFDPQVERDNASGTTLQDYEKWVSEIN